MRKCVILSVGLLLVLGRIAVAGPPQRHAVIVGINDYADARIADLKYAESDARAVYATLTDPKIGRFPKENVTLILGQAATPSAIKASLYKLRGAGKDDLVVVFYSGHGAKEGDEAFWVTQNADAKALPATSLTNSDIRKYLAMIPSQRLVMLLDCCYAASTVKKSLADPTKLFGDFAGKGRVTIAGSADNQEALEYTDKKAGVFTYYLVQGLQGKADTNDDGAVTFGELWGYLGENVRRASVKQGGLHEPVIITESGITPQFLLTLNPAARAINDKSLVALRKLFDESRITGAQYDEGRKALTEPAIDPVARAKRDVYAELVAGRLAPKYVDAALKDAVAEARAAEAPVAPSGQKPTLAVVPFDVLGEVRVKDAGAILAERMLPLFSGRYNLVDQAQLRRFLDQDDLTLAGLAEVIHRPTTKGLTKAVKLRGVRYLVVGTIAGQPGGALSVTARLVDWQTGGIAGGRVAQVGAEDWAQLQKRLPLLAAKLTGSLGEIGPGPAVPLPPLPGGVDDLTARVLQLEAIEGELKRAEQTLTDKHPRIAFLRENLRKLAKGLSPDVEGKLKELQAEDVKLAKLYKEAHPQRAALLGQIAELEKTRRGVLARAFSPPKELTLDLGQGVSLNLVLIPSGKFMMGSPETEKDRSSDEGPQREVTISKAFYLGVTEVTQAQWKSVMGTEPWKGQEYVKEGADHAASYINWDDATLFCKALSKKMGRPVRLPTEAEWEYGCRAGRQTRFHYGDDEDYSELGDYAWYRSNAYDKDEKYAHPVGRKKPNAWGLYDMHGNMWEWCSDRYGLYANAKLIDPQGQGFGSDRVLRGGGWLNGPHGCRSAFRLRSSTVGRGIGGGFRVVVPLD